MLFLLFLTWSWGSEKLRILRGFPPNVIMHFLKQEEFYYVSLHNSTSFRVWSDITSLPSSKESGGNKVAIWTDEREPFSFWLYMKHFIIFQNMLQQNLNILFDIPSTLCNPRKLFYFFHMSNFAPFI